MKVSLPGLMLAALVLGLTSCDRKRPTLFELLPPDRTGISFSNDIVESDTFNILTFEYIYNGGGVGVADFNNDGLRDLFFAGNVVPNRLYVNRGDFRFDDVTDVAKVNVAGRWNSGVTVVDINNDGWMDLYVTATTRPDPKDRSNLLFINGGLNNEGIPVFTEEAEQYGVDDQGFSVMAAFFDYDLDGDIDLYVLTNEKMANTVPTSYRAKIVDGSAPNNDRLYRNNGDKTFTNVTKEAGILIEGFGLGLAIGDLNTDGWPDIYVSNDYLANDILYINNQDGTFTNRIAEFIGHQSQFSMGNDIADINNDGLPDIMTTDMLPETNFRKKTTIGNKSYATYIYNENYGYEYQYVRNMLHLNNGLGKGIPFSEIGQLSGVFQTEWSWSPLFVDLDNDGHKDLIVTNGFPKDVTDKDFANYRADVGNLASPGFLNDSIPVVKIPNYAFRNGGNLIFTDVTTKWGLDQPSFSNGAAFVDLDNDGDMDYVTNNINDKAFVYKNLLYDAEDHPSTNGYLDLVLVGPEGNRQGIGAKVTLYSEGRLQFQECSLYRGFLSSVDQAIHFGTGTDAVDSIVVVWPGGQAQSVNKPGVNKSITIEFAPRMANASPGRRSPILREVSKAIGLDFIHEEEDFIDFNQQRTLPHKFSQSGPGLATGDINGDGLDDLIVGGSVGHQHSAYLQGRDGRFKLNSKSNSDAQKKTEDQGLLLFDADGDTDLDLYIVSGGFEGSDSSDYQDRLLLNDGKGKFSETNSALPQTTASGSCVRAADFDVDGDLDLFVGGRVVPGSYPTAARSYLLRNDAGKFADVTKAMCPELEYAGLIVDAVWSDYDGDGRRDLVVAGEFMPVMFYHNDGDHFSAIKNSGIENEKGWWNSIAPADFDMDGDIDYAVGNLGWNNNFQISSSLPLKVFAKDFDGNGSVDPVLACYMRESMSDTVKKLFPVHFWDEMNSQSPAFRRKFTRYKQFGRATLDKLLSPAEQNGALILEANHVGSALVRNLGGGKFAIEDLPVLAQVAPVFGMLADDVNDDGMPDLLMVGNDHGNEVFAGKYDAFVGLILIGRGDGTFEVNPARESGFVVPGDAKALVRLSAFSGDYYVTSQNKGRLLAFAQSDRQRPMFKPAASDSWAELTLSSGKKVRVEFNYGSGFSSQSSRSLPLAAGVSSLTVHDWTGKSREVAVPGGI